MRLARHRALQDDVLVIFIKDFDTLKSRCKVLWIINMDLVSGVPRLTAEVSEY